jgi:DNA-binding CsgD family transcriptional regulator
MRKLSFTGFLKHYVTYLTDSDTRSVHMLARLAASNRPRATEPLFLYAVMAGRLPLLLQAARGTHLENDYSTLASLFPTPDLLLKALRDDDDRLALRYHKVYRSYLTQVSKTDTDRQASLLMRERTLEEMRKKGLSKYRVYTDLGLNPGNVNTYLKNANVTAVSRKTARAILDYVVSA